MSFLVENKSLPKLVGIKSLTDFLLGEYDAVQPFEAPSLPICKGKLKRCNMVTKDVATMFQDIPIIFLRFVFLQKS